MITSAPEVDQGRGDGGRPQGRALDDPHAVQRRRRRHRTSRRRRPDRSGRRHGRPEPGPRHTGAMETEALDDALTVFAATAPRLRVARPGQPRPDGRRGAGAPGPRRRHRGLGGAATGARLDEAPPPAGRPLTEEDWPAALGQADRFPEWLALFEREVADRPPAAVVGEWAPRLLPGCRRCGHPRADPHRPRRARPGRRPTPPPRRLEVASGAGVLGLELPELPGPPLLIGHEGVARGAGRPAVPPRGRAAPGAHQRQGGGASPTSPTSSSRRWPRSAGPAARWSCSTSWPRAGRGLPAQRRRRRGHRPPARRHVAAGLRAAAARGWPRRTATPPWATSGRPWRRCTSPTTSTAGAPVPTGASPSADALVDAGAGLR